MIPKDALSAATEAVMAIDGPATLGSAEVVAAALEAAAPYLRAQALEDAADELVWKRPEKSPCEAIEACCGSESSCDVMRPSTSVVGEHWLRARAATERGQGND